MTAIMDFAFSLLSSSSSSSRLVLVLLLSRSHETRIYINSSLQRL